MWGNNKKERSRHKFNEQVLKPNIKEGRESIWRRQGRKNDKKKELEVGNEFNFLKIKLWLCLIIYQLFFL